MPEIYDWKKELQIDRDELLKEAAISRRLSRTCAFLTGVSLSAPVMGEAYNSMPSRLSLVGIAGLGVGAIILNRQSARQEEELRIMHEDTGQQGSNLIILSSYALER